MSFDSKSFDKILWEKGVGETCLYDSLFSTQREKGVDIPLNIGWTVSLEKGNDLGWSSREAVYKALSLSMLMAKNAFPNSKLFLCVDDTTKEELKNVVLPEFTFLQIERNVTDLWSTLKLQAYKKLDDLEGGFLHIDLDVFLGAGIGRFLNADIMLQHTEAVNEEDYCVYQKEELEFAGYTFKYKPMNFGFFLCKNGLPKEARGYIENMNEIIFADTGSLDRRKLNVCIEQAAFREMLGEVKGLIETDNQDIALATGVGVDAICNYIGYTHLYAGSKQKYEHIIDELLSRWVWH